MEDPLIISMEQMPSTREDISPANVEQRPSTMDDARSTNPESAPSAKEGPSIPEEVHDLVQKIKTGSSALSQGGETRRKQLLADARALCLTLETPFETLLRITWSQSTYYTVMKIAVDVNLFEKLAQNDGRPKTILQLAEMTGTSAELMGRMIRHLGAMGTVLELEDGFYAPSRLAKNLTIPVYRDTVAACFDMQGPTLSNLPRYLAETGYKDPINPVDGPWQYGHRTSLQFFDWLVANPKTFSAFNNHMSAYSQGRPSWMETDFYPVNERLINGFNADKDSVLLVDQAGGLGHDLEELCRRLPHAPGRLVLQDQAKVVDAVKVDLDPRIAPMAHDIFTPQPIHGARAYFMHSILHDWPDEKCREILHHLVTAMKPGYSKILINEIVIPNRGAHPAATGLDWLMMALMSSSERTEKAWRELLESVGLTVVGIWTHSPGTESLIEAELLEGGHSSSR